MQHFFLGFTLFCQALLLPPLSFRGIIFWLKFFNFSLWPLCQHSSSIDRLLEKISCISREHSTSPLARLYLTFHPQYSSFSSCSKSFLVGIFPLTSRDHLSVNQQPTKGCISRWDHWNSPSACLNLTFLYFLPLDSSFNSPSLTMH